jgi:hypothetical protein
MRAVLDHLTADDEIGVVGFGQSLRLPYGNRDLEGFVQAPHLRLRSPGLDLIIASIVSATGAVHGAAGTRSVVSVADTIFDRDWVNGELRLVQHEFGDSVFTSIKRGHAKVIANGGVATATTATTMIIDAATDTIAWPAHGRPNGSQMQFSTTGTLPGLPLNVPVYVRDATENTFKVSLDPYGTAINIAGGAGIHTATARAYLLVEWQSEFQAPTAGVTFSIGTPGVVNHTNHRINEGSTVSFDVNTPPELTPGVKYYVVAPTPNAYNVSATFGGAAIAFSGAGGAATATPDLLAFLAGYVHLHDRFNSYDSVVVVTPYQPGQPGDYPSGTPIVPGFTLPSDVTSYADAGLALPYAWNEGIEGHGAAGTVAVVGLVCTLQGGQTIDDKLFAGGFARVGPAKGKVASNTTTTFTVESWTPIGPTGVGTHEYELHLPHWRNNPHHFTAGEGFLYPSAHSQPGGLFATSQGFTYSRPRGRLVASCVARSLASMPTSIAINATGLAVLRTNGSGQLTCSIVSGRLRIQRATNTRDPATGLIQFEDFVRPGAIVGLVNMGQTPGIDNFWRVHSYKHATAAAGSYIDLEVLPEILGSVPGAVAGVVPANAVITRMFWEPQHRFGSLIELCWRMAQSLGRRVVVASLGINGASQIASFSNNTVGFQGKLGWWDDDEVFDWTPSSAGGAAARLKRLVDFIAPRAVQASFGTSKKWKVLAIDGWQGETDATTAAGRELAQRTIATFANWLRSLITAAGLSPYPKKARIPLQWSQIATFPWITLGGDTEGKINKAITRFVTYDVGFSATIAVDDQAGQKLPDQLHFNGIAEAVLGKRAAEALLPLIEFAFQFAVGPDAIAVANAALSLIGDSPNVTSLEVPNSTQAKLCAQFIFEARDEVLQAHPWTVATRRKSFVEVENTVASYLYAYAVPADVLLPTKILDPEGTDDLQIGVANQVPAAYGRRPVVSSTALEPASQPFDMETDHEDNRVLRTNQANALVVYTAFNVGFELWHPLMRKACVFHLAHLLVGGTTKGKTGTAQSRELLQMSRALIAEAAEADAEWQRDVRPQKRCDWLP